MSENRFYRRDENNVLHFVNDPATEAETEASGFRLYFVKYKHIPDLVAGHLAVFANGKVALAWLVGLKGISIYDSLESLTENKHILLAYDIVKAETTADFHPFVLNRKQDISGVSGIGVVAQGVEFSNGKTVLVWLTGLTSVAVYDSLDIMKRIHCHDGATEVLPVLPPTNP